MHPQGLTHREMFRGEMVTIKAGEYVLMDYEDAYQFKGQFCPIKVDAQGVHDPVSFKVLKLEPNSDKLVRVEDQTKKFVCQRDGKVFATKAELDSYTDLNYKDEVFSDDALDEVIESEEPVIAKKQRGRPPKEKSL